MRTLKLQRSRFVLYCGRTFAFARENSTTRRYGTLGDDIDPVLIIVPANLVVLLQKTITFFTVGPFSEIEFLWLPLRNVQSSSLGSANLAESIAPSDPIS